MCCGCKVNLAADPMWLPYVISLYYMKKTSHNHPLSRLSTTWATTLWLKQSTECQERSQIGHIFFTHFWLCLRMAMYLCIFYVTPSVNLDLWEGCVKHDQEKLVRNTLPMGNRKDIHTESFLELLFCREWCESLLLLIEHDWAKQDGNWKESYPSGVF